jgi:type VI secretion system protein ImpM
MVKPGRVCWWGKLPARGDFVGRGLPARWRADWDGWLQRGLALAATAADGGVLHDRLSNFAPWRYVALPTRGEPWCGLFVASHDRVGRAFPLTLAERMAPWMSPRENASRLRPLLDAAWNGPDALEAAIAALPPLHARGPGPAMPWPAAPCSLWWPLDAPDGALPLASAWPPPPPLLLRLLDQVAPHQIASAE